MTDFKLVINNSVYASTLSSSSRMRTKPSECEKLCSCVD